MSNSPEIANIDFERLFFPKAIGIIGVSPDMRGGSFFVRCMKDRFRGPIYLFNPRFQGKIYMATKYIVQSLKLMIQ